MLKQNRVYQGNCLELMKNIADNSIDMILCDLPYGTTSCEWDTIIPFDKLWEQYERIIKDNGAIVLTATQPFTSALIMSNIKMFKYSWVWIKNPSGFMNAKKMPLKSTEDVCVFYRKMPTYNPQGLRSVNKKVYMRKRTSKSAYGNMGVNKNDGMEYVQEFENYPSNIIDIPSVKGLHPTQKPVKLFEYLIKTYSNPNDLILDNCAGSGTTAVACENTNRNFILIELDEKYCEIAKERISNSKQVSVLDF